MKNSQTLPYKKQKCLTSTKKNVCPYALAWRCPASVFESENVKLSFSDRAIRFSKYGTFRHTNKQPRLYHPQNMKSWKSQKNRKQTHTPSCVASFSLPLTELEGTVLPLAPLRDIKKRYACVGRRTQITPNPTVKVEICKFQQESNLSTLKSKVYSHENSKRAAKFNGHFSLLRIFSSSYTYFPLLNQSFEVQKTYTNLVLNSIACLVLSSHKP